MKIGTNKKIDIAKDFLFGFYRGTNYYINKSLSRGMDPTCVEIMVTGRCNAKCKICNMWQYNSTDTMSLKDLQKLFSSDVLSNTRTVIVGGGEPFLRGDVVEICEAIVQKLKSLQEIILFSNGILGQRIVKNIQ